MQNKPGQLSFEAPYFQDPGGASGHFMVRFNAGHDIKKHFEFLGHDFNCQTFHISSQAFGYHADLDSNLLNSIRSDAGVMLVEDDFGETTNEHRRGKVKLNSTTVDCTAGCEAPYRRSPGGPTGRYLVFFRPHYTIREHFHAIQRGFALSEWHIVNGYSASMDVDLLAAVRSDSGVKAIEDDLANAPAEPQLPYYTHYAPASPGEYRVALRPSYPVQKHFALLGIHYDSKNFIEEVYGLRRYSLPEFGLEIEERPDRDGTGAGYVVEGLNDALFRAVMCDPGVSSILSTPSDGYFTYDEDEDDMVGIFD